jgi:transcriptional regulator with XRE-family HTH domain
MRQRQFRVGVGAFIASRRKAAGLSTTQLAARMGVGEAYVRHLETERHIPSPDNCAAIAKILELGGEESQELERLVYAAAAGQGALQLARRLATRGERLHQALPPPGDQAPGPADSEGADNDQEAHALLTAILAEPQMREVVIQMLRTLALPGIAPADSSAASQPPPSEETP